MAAGTPLRELLAITGICQAESLARYARHVDGAPTKAALRAWAKRRQGAEHGRRRAGDPRAWQCSGPGDRGIRRRAHRPQREDPVIEAALAHVRGQRTRFASVELLLCSGG